MLLGAGRERPGGRRRRLRRRAATRSPATVTRPVAARSPAARPGCPAERTRRPRSSRVGDCGNDVKHAELDPQLEGVRRRRAGLGRRVRRVDRGRRPQPSSAGRRPARLTASLDDATTRAGRRALDSQGRRHLVRPRLLRQRDGLRRELTRRIVGVAHKTLPCGTKVTIRYEGTLRPHHGHRPRPLRQGRPWDLTYAAAAQLGFEGVDTIQVASSLARSAERRARRRQGSPAGGYPLGADGVRAMRRQGAPASSPGPGADSAALRPGSGTRSAPAGRPPRGSPRRSSRARAPPRRGAGFGRRRRSAAPRGRRAAPASFSSADLKLRASEISSRPRPARPRARACWAIE